MRSGHVNPTTTHPQELRPGTAVEPLAVQRPGDGARIAEIYVERDESKRQMLIER